MRTDCAFPLALVVVAALAACGGGDADSSGIGLSWDAMADSTQRVAILTGFDGPESVMYDPEQDVWFVSVFNGPSGERDGNGYVSRVQAEDGTTEVLRFAVGTDEHPFHAGRGMALQGDTLWVADAQGIHGFHRETGEQLLFVDMRALDPGFLNDIAVGPDGAVYVTDTGSSAVYRARPDEPQVAVQGEELGNPNGILWDPERRAFWIAPWSGGSELRLWDPGSGEVTRPYTTAPAERMDGAVLWGGHLLVASQADSAIHAVSDSRSGAYLPSLGRPADLGLDTRRGRLAVPVVALNQVEIWQLPGTGGS
jgi:sugar lactone lactonase YvrE